MRAFHAMAVWALVVIAAPAAAMQAAGPPPAAAGEATDASWRVEANAAVAEANHWRWRLRFLERRGDTLTVGLSVRNDATTGRPIYLDADYMEAVALVDAETGARFPLLAAKGISESAVAVDRRSSMRAEFTFRFPEGAREVTFASRWVSMRMQGAAAAMRVDFPIALPPAGA